MRLIAALWLLLSPPGGEPSVPVGDDPEAPVDVAPAPMPEPRNVPVDWQPPVDPTSDQQVEQQQVQPHPPPPDDWPPPPPPPYDQVGAGQTVKVAGKRSRRPRRGHRRDVEPSRTTPPRDFSRLRARPWGGTWRHWGAPLLSGLGIPGLGQLANGQPLKGVALIYGTLGLLAGTVALYQADHDGSRPVGVEAMRLGTYGVMSTALPMLWIYAIADAWREAHEEEVEPKLDHRLRVSLARTATVGFRADPQRPGFYDEWTAALIGQVAPRWSFGVADLSIKPDAALHVGVVQFGLRAGYRVYERRRFWLELALGTAMQVRVHRPAQPLDPDLPRPDNSRHFGAIPYAQLDLRWFVLDRLSLDLTPRLSVPVTTRWYSVDRALPRYAPTLELGGSVSLYF